MAVAPFSGVRPVPRAHRWAAIAAASLALALLAACVPAIDVEVETDGEDADLPPGPSVDVGHEVVFTYRVDNVGNVPLFPVIVTDDSGTPGDPSDDFNPAFVSGDGNGDGVLDIDETWVFSASRTVTRGQFTNVAMVGSGPVSDHDSSNHLGLETSVSLELLVNDQPADRAPGLLVAAGAELLWRFEVTNTGDVGLTAVRVSADRGAIACPGAELSPGEAMSCPLEGTAGEGQGAVVGLVEATGETGIAVEGADLAHHFGVIESLDLEVLTNGVDADVPETATSNFLAVGSRVTWTYEVTNRGNVALTNIDVADDRLGPICQRERIEVGDSFSCEVTGEARSGLYVNTATAIGRSPLGRIRDADTSHYLGFVEVPPSATLAASATPSPTATVSPPAPTPQPTVSPPTPEATTAPETPTPGHDPSATRTPAPTPVGPPPEPPGAGSGLRDGPLSALGMPLLLIGLLTFAASMAALSWARQRPSSD